MFQNNRILKNFLWAWSFGCIFAAAAAPQAIPGSSVIPAEKNAGYVSELFLEETFDQTSYKVGRITSGGDGKSIHGRRVVSVKSGNMDITDKIAKSKPFSLHLNRDKHPGSLLIVRNAEIPAGHDCRIYFSIFIGRNQAILLLSDGKSNKFPGAMLIQNTKIFGWASNKKWAHAANIDIVPDTWNDYVIDISVNENSYRFGKVAADGSVKFAPMVFPLQTKEQIKGVLLSQQPKVNTDSYIDDIRMVVDKHLSIRGRKEVANTARVWLFGERNPTYGSLCVNQPSRAAIVKPRKGQLMEFDFVTPPTLSGVRILSGDDNGKSVMGKANIYIINNLGHRIKVGYLPGGEKKAILEFPMQEKVNKLQIEFLDETPIDFRRFYFYTPPGTAEHQLDERFKSIISGDFRLPVYDCQYPNQQKAELTIINSRSENQEVLISMRKRTDNKIVIKPFDAVLKPGSNSIKFDLTELANGEYIVTVEDKIADIAGQRGKIRRLLRLATSPECSAERPEKLENFKMYFPDNFFFAKHSNLKVTPGSAKCHPVVIGNDSDDAFIVYGSHMKLDKKTGKIVVEYNTYNRLWQAKSKKTYTATEIDISQGKWDIKPGTMPKSDYAVNPMKGIDLPRAATPDNAPKPVNGKLKYRFYDPEKDGPVNLREVKLVWVSPAQKDEIGYDEYDWQVIRPPHTTTWPIWYRPNGEAVILRKTPLIFSQNDGSGFENADSGSDLGVGQFLSDDGKTLCYAQGRHLNRFPPYNTPYDNIPERTRIIAMWTTTDGINWNRFYVGVPGIEQPVNEQHYGGYLIRVPNSGGLRIVFINRYNCYTQQMSAIIVFSRDGRRWTRIQDADDYAGNGEFNDWRHGCGYVSDIFLERDGKYYHFLKWNTNIYHFQSEVASYMNATKDNLTTEYMKSRMQPRQLEKWPLFRKYFDGSWEKLARHTRGAYCSVGIAELRKDGFYELSAAPGKVGSFETYPVSSSGKLSANLLTGKDGYAKFTLIDENGKTIGEKTVPANTDNVEVMLFEKLPTGKFKVKCEFTDTKIFTLNFTK